MARGMSRKDRIILKLIMAVALGTFLFGLGMILIGIFSDKPAQKTAPAGSPNVLAPSASRCASIAIPFCPASRPVASPDFPLRQTMEVFSLK
jgi:hypothetical protein